MKEWIRADLKKFMPYHSPEKPCVAKLDANESPYNLSQNVRDNFIKWIQENENLNIYPDTDQVELRNVLSAFYNVEPQNVICTVGSDQLIDCITRLFLEAGDVVVVPKPSFSMYKNTTVMNHGKILEVELEKDFSYEEDKLIDAVKANNAKILFLCSPNNPTGTSLTIEQMKKIIENVSCPVIVDEAYAEFDDVTMIPYINDYKNMMVLRTFSKAYGLAGARIGYGIAHTAFIEAVEIVKAPYNLSTISQFLAMEVIKDSEQYKSRMEEIKAERDFMYEQLKKFKWLQVYPSNANFLLIESERDMDKKLLEANILVRSFSIESDKVRRIRLSIGDRQSNEKVIEVFLSMED